MTRLVFSLLALATLLGGCEARRTLGEQCELSTQCDAPLVCRLARCRVHCGTQRDCPAGTLCVPADGGGVCLLPDERECGRDSECPDELVCRAERCGPMCNDDRDCAGARCVEQVCVDMADEPCALPSDCGPGLVCIDGRCAPPCREDRDCREGSECVDGTCELIVVEIDAGLTDAGPPDAGPPDAGSGPTLVRTCTVPDDCRAPNVVAFGCVDNQCTITTCAADFGDCDGFYNSGCEADTRIDAAHCGACDMACGAGGECSASSCDGIASVAYGTWNLCVVRDNGRVACTGRGSGGQLGTGVPIFGSTIFRDPLVAVGVSDATLVAPGPGTVCALRADGRVSCTGAGANGQIGDGTWTGRWAHRYAAGLTDAEDVDVGRSHVCAVRATGRVVCWGEGVEGGLGNGSVARVNTPTEVSGITDAVRVAAGRDFGCAVRTGGSLECWGSDRVGTLGDGPTGMDPSCTQPCSLVPVPVRWIMDAVDVVAATYRVCALRSTGEVACWGDRFGSGGTTLARIPQAIAGISDAVQIAADGEAICVRRSSGQVSCFGDNGRGALGDGTYTDSPITPVDVVGVTDATDIAIGPNGGCALTTSRGLVCWGGNNDGTFGPDGFGEEWLPARPAGGFNP